ncbi:DUF1002 domain-containing protein [Salipaludibacillus sp. LMS25]|jgi:uncharacterized protein YpuA (DUF1002 family)|uniref:DUF1002 domain-containing protein n=1 Tax=Salipaludibacillus sp. LMS25 TaxID=2924031 RepID=UPI0020D0E2BB|nr:DUF1002 domain-containing protein [Salipaludibacillus sp. LMS25]UTR14412.1 DUF1002 domain-containing protein [Salipaludibacillus sp. LMS25]
MRTVYKTAVSTFAIWLLFVSVVFADAAPGDEIVTLGEDLTPQQRETLLNEMNVNENEVLIVTVTNEEEHQYLGDYISASVIGSNALSSSKITLLEEGEGVDVETNRINWVSEGMYANALITAGVKDANIYVTAPFNVSGTGALTGLIKAYEASTDEVIPEDQKQVANEELVKTAELSDEHGVEDATELMARIKEALAEEDIETEEDLRALIQRIAGELGMTLTDEELNGLVSLFNRMKDLNIDWDQVQNQIGKIRENIGDFLSSEEGQGFIQSILDFISSLIDIVRGWFSS